MLFLKFVVLLLMTASFIHSADENNLLLIGKMKSIDGDSVDLRIYKGKVVLIVNVASYCGYTKQYEALEKLHKKYADKGLAILGFPCNQFGQQEPDSETEIKSFCQTKFGVDFNLFAKIDVNGEYAAPLYKYLTSDQLPLADKGAVKWNFEKFLIDRQGRPIARFRSKVKPDDPEIINAIEAALRENLN